MATLLFFAFLSGVITIFAPCIWPILPIVLSASVGGGRRPLGIALGIAASFSFFTLALSYIVHIIPFDPNIIRMIAVLVIGALGLSLTIPMISRVLEGWVSRVSSRFAPAASSSIGAQSGFRGGFFVGISLGAVWSPCAGPILAAVATFAATRAVSIEVVFLTLAFAAGVAIPLFLLALLGNRAFEKSRLLNRYTGRIQQVFGVIMVLAAIAIYAGFDKQLQTKLLDLFPSYGSFVTSIEENDAVSSALEQLGGASASDTALESSKSASSGESLPNLGRAPELASAGPWLNTDGEELSLTDLRGKVVLVDFWTYSCINCIRTLPFVTRWYDTYKDQGFVVIGVHTPEFEFEKKTENVADAIDRYAIHYPVVQDNDYGTWRAYRNRYWPAHYLIDAEGNIREKHFGEGKYDETEAAIRSLLAEMGASAEVGATSLADVPDETPSIRLTPETYVGLARLDRFDSQESPSPGTSTYTLPKTLPLNHFAYAGSWMIDDENGTAQEDASLSIRFHAGKVFLVLSPPAGGIGIVRVFLDGNPVGIYAGSDVRDGMVRVDSSRLYELVNLRDGAGDHVLRLDFETPGTSAYAFTFGE